MLGPEDIDAQCGSMISISYLRFMELRRVICMSSQFPDEVQALEKDGQIENLTNLKDGEHS